MREIKSNRYLQKEAIFGDFPVGDPGLPGNLTEMDIPGGVDTDEVDNRTGETEAEVNWPEFKVWFEQGGEALPAFLKGRMSPTPVKISYKYNYDYNDNNVNNVRIIQIKDYNTGQIITDPYISESFGEYFMDQIKNDIEMI